MKAISKLWQCWQLFKKHIAKIHFRVSFLRVLLLVAFAVAVMVSESIVAGVLIIWREWEANKRAKAMEDAARELAKATTNTETGQQQERLKNAIKYLGHGNDSVRMGGAYELFHLAKDTRDLRQKVLGILCGHIRQTTGKDDYQTKHKIKPSEEIQSLLTLLFMDEHDVFEDCSINLQDSYLNGATLSQARLKKADLRRVQLQEAVLSRAQLQGTNLLEAQLQKADLSKAQLQEANLMNARLQSANLPAAQLQGADLRYAQLQGTSLFRARLQEADLMEAQLQGAHLVYVQLQKAGLRHAQLQGADLAAARLQGADLSKAQLQKADLGLAQLQGAKLLETRLQEAVLEHAQLQGTNLSNAQLQGADLLGAQLQGTTLSKAQLRGAILWGAQLQGADLSKAQLQGASLMDAQLQGTKLSKAQLQGASLMDAQLQGTKLSKAQLQGVSSFEANPFSSARFESKIKNRIGKPSDLAGIIFAGGLQQRDLKTLCRSLSAEKKQTLRETLRPHVGQPVSHELPANSGAVIGAYTQEEAKQWIAEYNDAMRKASRADDTADADSAPDSDKDKRD